MASIHHLIKAAFMVFIALLFAVMLFWTPSSDKQQLKPFKLLGVLLVGILIAFVLLKAYPSGTTPTKLL